MFSGSREHEFEVCLQFLKLDNLEEKTFKLIPRARAPT